MHPGLKRILAGLAAALLAVSAHAANLTPDELTAATSINNTDLLVIYPAGGPMKSVQWSVAKALMQAALGTAYLQVSNNLSDLSSATTARANLGLGTSAIVNTGTSGATIPLLNGANTWSNTQNISWGAGTTLLTLNQTNSAYNDDIAFSNNGTPKWFLGVQTNDQNEWILYNYTDSTYNINCSVSTDKCDFAHTPTVGGVAIGLSTQAANSVLANFTGSTALPIANTVPACTGALTYTNASGFGCNTGVGTGTVTTTGSPASGELAKFSGSTSLTNGDLSGDCTTSGTLAITCLKTNGTLFGTAATVNTGTAGATIPLLNGTNTWSAGQQFNATVDIATPTSSAALIMNQANGSSYNNEIIYQTSGTNTWEAATFHGTNDYLLFNYNTSVTDYICTYAADVCSFTNTPTVGSTALVLTTDSRFGGVTQNSQSTGYTLVLGDAGKQIYHPSADTTARTWTIPANASVALAVGTKIDLVNDCSAGIVTVAITSDTLVWFTAGTTGSRSLAPCGEATLSKVTSTRWVITGTGLS